MRLQLGDRVSPNQTVCLLQFVCVFFYYNGRMLRVIAAREVFCKCSHVRSALKSTMSNRGGTGRHTGDEELSAIEKPSQALKPSVSSLSSESGVDRRADNSLIFNDFPDFRPNLSPKEVLQMGSFGGTYFRPIKSSVTGEKYKDVWREFPEDWFVGLRISIQVASPLYDEKVNRYGLKCGGSLETWEQSGWMRKQDPYGWLQWYCRFYQGRRSEDDERQVGRWIRCAGVNGRWRTNLISKVVKQNAKYDDAKVFPIIRQALQHWAYQLSEEDFKLGTKRIKPK